MTRIILVLALSAWLFCLGSYSGRVQAENRVYVSPRALQQANLVEIEGYNAESKLWIEIGSGFVARFNGKSYVLTASHVVTSPKEVSKTFPNPYLMVNHSAEIPSVTKYRAKYQGKINEVGSVVRSEEKDLAWLKLPATGGLELAERNPDIEANVYMLGCPLDVHNFYSRGMVEVYTPRGHMRSDTPGHYGSSGSGLVDEEGKIVGLMQRFGVMPPAAGFYDARPVEDIRKFLKDKG